MDCVFCRLLPTCVFVWLSERSRSDFIRIDNGLSWITSPARNSAVCLLGSDQMSHGPAFTVLYQCINDSIRSSMALRRTGIDTVGRIRISET